MLPSQNNSYTLDDCDRIEKELDVPHRRRVVRKAKRAAKYFEMGSGSSSYWKDALDILKHYKLYHF